MAPAYNETIHGLGGLRCLLPRRAGGVIGMLRDQFVEVAPSRPQLPVVQDFSSHGRETHGGGA
jgi:hypothetical protein